jgi:hypothetical protein
VAKKAILYHSALLSYLNIPVQGLTVPECYFSLRLFFSQTFSGCSFWARDDVDTSLYNVPPNLIYEIQPDGSRPAELAQYCRMFLAHPNHLGLSTDSDNAGGFESKHDQRHD